MAFNAIIRTRIALFAVAWFLVMPVCIKSGDRSRLQKQWQKYKYSNDSVFEIFSVRV